MTEIPGYIKEQAMVEEKCKEQAIAGAVEKLEEAQAAFKLEILQIVGMGNYGARKKESTITADPSVAQYA